MRCRLAFLAAALPFALAGCAGTPPAPPPLKLTLLHTNDHHGRFWPNEKGEGGLAARKTIVDRVRAEVAAAGGHVLLLDAGDVNTGTPESDRLDAEPDFKGMSRIGYDAQAVGNHEFDRPPAVLEKQRQWAAHPMLAANLYRDGRRVFEPYRIFERGGRRIAVVGLTTEDTRQAAAPDHVAGIEFRPAIDEAAALVPQLRAKADLVVAATHIGHYPDGAHGSSAPGDVELARAVPGIDVIVGGHSQNPVCMKAENVRDEDWQPGRPCAPDRQNGTWILQAHEWGKYVGRADFVVDAGRVELLRYELLPVNLRRPGDTALVAAPVPEDESMRDFLAPYRAAEDPQHRVVVGTAADAFDGGRDRLRTGAAPLGTLVARALREAADADLAVTNGGGIRDGLQAGELRYGDLVKTQVRDGRLVVVQLSGAELLQWIGDVGSKATPGWGGWPQTDRLAVEFAAGRVVAARVGGQPVDPARRYALALNRFIAGGGDGYPDLSGHPGYRDTGEDIAALLRRHVERQGPLRLADYAPPR